MKTLGWIIGACLTLVIVAAAGFWLMLGDGCGNDRVARIPSPDGKLDAIVFQRDCGATTGFSTQISVLKADRSLGNNPGNLFIADTDHGAAPSGPGGGPRVHVQWASPTSLTVVHDPRARIFLASPASGNVHVLYRAAK
jgi:hypothetical protein